MLRIFSYLPNPRVWKSLIAAEYCGVKIEVVGAKPTELGQWLWDYEARPMEEHERSPDSSHARASRRGFSGTIYKTILNGFDKGGLRGNAFINVNNL